MNENPVIESKFRLVHIAARRAEQLIQGARPKVAGSRHTKSTRLALEEVDLNLVRWQLPEALLTQQEEEGEPGSEDLQGTPSE